MQLHDVGAEDDHMVYNASIFWDAKEHPWMNLASIHLTALLPDDVIETTRFSVARLPSDTLAFPEATSVYDFNIVPNLREEVYLQCQVRISECSSFAAYNYLLFPASSTNQHSGSETRSGSTSG